MTVSHPLESGALEREASTRHEMVWIPGGTFRMGSDKHYPEEAPVHRVSVDGFWVDRTPVTNNQFRKFVNATGYVTFAEIKPEAKDYLDGLCMCADSHIQCGPLHLLCHWNPSNPMKSMRRYRTRTIQNKVFLYDYFSTAANPPFSRSFKSRFRRGFLYGVADCRGKTCCYFPVKTGMTPCCRSDLFAFGFRSSSAVTSAIINFLLAIQSSTIGVPRRWGSGGPGKGGLSCAPRALGQALVATARGQGRSWRERVLTRRERPKHSLSVTVTGR
jgi:hypothetical protein